LLAVREIRRDARDREQPECGKHDRKSRQRVVARGAARLRGDPHDAQ